VVVTSGQPEITRALTEGYGDERITVVVSRARRAVRATPCGWDLAPSARAHAVLYGDTPLLRAQI